MLMIQPHRVPSCAESPRGSSDRRRSGWCRSPSQCGFVHRRHVDEAAEGRVVDQDVEAAEPIDRRADQSRHVGVSADVRRNRGHPTGADASSCCSASRRRAGSVPLMTTDAPSASMACATARPMPREPPVTMPDLPSSMRMAGVAGSRRIQYRKRCRRSRYSARGSWAARSRARSPVSTWSHESRSSTIGRGGRRQGARHQAERPGRGLRHAARRHQRIFRGLRRQPRRPRRSARRGRMVRRCRLFSCWAAFTTCRLGPSSSPPAADNAGSCGSGDRAGASVRTPVVGSAAGSRSRRRSRPGGHGAGCLGDGRHPVARRRAAGLDRRVGRHDRRRHASDSTRVASGNSRVSSSVCAPAGRLDPISSHQRRRP